MRPGVNRIVRRVRLGTEAAFALIGAGIAIRVLPKSRMASLLGGHAGSPSEYRATTRASVDAQRVGMAVERVAGLLPWHPVCLPQAIATRWMLTRRGIPSEAHLGIVTTKPFSAHAW